MPPRNDPDRDPYAVNRRKRVEGPKVRVIAVFEEPLVERLDAWGVEKGSRAESTR